MPDKHAKLSPSAAARWINCPGSIRLSEKVPPPPSSDYADEGTLAHAVAETKLLRETRILTARIYNDRIKKAQASEYWSGEMDEATELYADTVLEHLAGAGDDATLMVEQLLNLDEWAPGSFGTSDAVIIGGDTIEVIDLKYGKGVRVDAEDNPQLRLYALGAAGLFGDLYDFKNVKTTIIQPRLSHVSSEELPLEELRAWGEQVVRPAAKAAAAGTGQTACGNWCRWCPAKAVCRTRAEANLELAKMDFRKPEILSAEEIGEVLRKADELQRWAADVQDYALKQAMDGEHIDGWKLVEGRSVRKYADDLKVAEVLQAAGYAEAMLYERKLNGLTAMEKLVGKKKLAELLGDLIIKPAGKPVLVPEDDRREPIASANSAREDFADGN